MSHPFVMNGRRVLAIASLALGPLPAFAQQVSQKIVGHIVKPDRVEATDARVASLRRPEGFAITRFAEGLGKPRMIAVAEDGTVYITRREPGDLLRLRDADGDGKAEHDVVFTSEGLHGICINGAQMYLTTVKEVFVAPMAEPGSIGQPTRIIEDLPDGGQHPNRTLAVGPDGMLYISVGSTCNACEEPNKENATMLRARPDGSSREVFARGLRNTIGFAWQPNTQQLWGMDHGIDWLGDDEQGEELNRIEEGADYGWPFVYGDGGFNLADEPPGMTWTEYAAKTRPSILTYTAHAAPMGMVFIRSPLFPREYQGDALVAMHGSWNRERPAGYEIVRIRFENDRPVSFEPFVSGFLADDGKTQFGRPVGLAFAKDGALLVTDDENGVVYRIALKNGPARP